jgi:tricorn protease-like protein
MSEQDPTSNQDILRQLDEFARRQREKLPRAGCTGWGVFGCIALAIVLLAIHWALQDLIPMLGMRLGVRLPVSLPTRDQSPIVLLGAYQGHTCAFDQSTSDPNKLTCYDSSLHELSIKQGKLSSYETFLWSPKGKIAFISRQDVGKGHIYVVDVTQPKLEVKQITQRHQDGLSDDFVLRADSPLAWSPGETAIAFVAFNGDTSDLFAAQVDGKRTRRITHYKAHITSVVWVTTDLLAFVSDMDGREKRYLIKTDGGSLQEW